MIKLIFLILFSILIAESQSVNKYSAEANKKLQESQDFSFRNLDKPFRMAKINMLWSKAVLRLTEPKLKSLFGELKIHDKEEMTWKKLKSEGMDKEGLHEAEMRKKLIGIMSTYGLLEHFEDVHNHKMHKNHEKFNDASDKYINKSFFKDKKLNKLWEKAEHAGFTIDELKTLREEFYHHQDKIDQYYSLLDDVQEGKKDNHENSIDEALDRFNTLDVSEQNELPSKDYLHKANLLRDKHRDLRDGYDRLHRLASSGPQSKEFIEPKVQGLWKIAVESNFTPDELESLRVELQHYERRLLKLRNMQLEAALNEDRHTAKIEMLGDKTDGLRLMDETIKRHARKVDILHEHLETKILQKHAEL